MTLNQTVSFGLCVSSFLSVFLSILSLSTVFWVTQSTDNDDTNYGLFLTESTDNKAVVTKCISNMTDLNCGYLNSSKGCGVVATIFGGFFFISHVISFGYPKNAINTVVTALLGFTQTFFGIMCLVIYSYFKEEYLNPVDDVNVEYPDGEEATYNWAFYTMIVSVVLSVTTSSATMLFLYAKIPGIRRKDSADLESETFLRQVKLSF